MAGRRFWFGLGLLCAALGGCGREAAVRGEEAREFALGTFCSVSLYDKASPEIFARVFARIREIEAVMSANREGTDLDRINRNAGIAPVNAPEELLEVLERARYYAELSGGSFDPTIGPLVRLWDTGSENPRVPGEDEIRKALALVNWRDLVIDREAGTAFLTRPGMALDLGAIAKGYAADEAARVLTEAGFRRGIVNLGGNIAVYGDRPGEPRRLWRIGVQDPAEPRGDYLGVLETGDASVVTSGVYERFFEEGGKRYHHLLSTRTGYPEDNGLLSVTVIADRSIDADALSTAVFTLGYERGLGLLETIPGTEALFVFGDRSVRGSPGALRRFTLTGGAYRLVF
jgi:thiamine biosynthesis lipoprotein